MSETFTITVEPLDREVECRSDQPILDACLRAGVWLPHACTHGTCGTCKVDVLDGVVLPLSRPGLAAEHGVIPRAAR